MSRSGPHKAVERCSIRARAWRWARLGANMQGFGPEAEQPEPQKFKETTCRKVQRSHPRLRFNFVRSASVEAEPPRRARLRSEKGPPEASEAITCQRVRWRIGSGSKSRCRRPLRAFIVAGCLRSDWHQELSPPSSFTTSSSNSKPISGRVLLRTPAPSGSKKRLPLLTGLCPCLCPCRCGDPWLCLCPCLSRLCRLLRSGRPDLCRRPRSLCGSGPNCLPLCRPYCSSALDPCRGPPAGQLEGLGWQTSRAALGVS